MQVSLEEWKKFIQDQENPHILQFGEWGELKSAYGWEPVRILNGNAGVQILFRQLPGGFSIGYIPKGPIGDLDLLIDELEKLCLAKRAIFLKVEPDEWENTSDVVEFVQKNDWKASRSIQPRRTVLLSLAGSEEDILSEMKQKTRYNIRLAEKKDIKIMQSSEVASFSRMVRETGLRDRFGVHSGAYYQRAYDLFNPAGLCELFIADYQGTPVAGLMAFTNKTTAWYMYGASTDKERNRMPAYLIQWAAMKWAKNMGCTHYDMWGIPDFNEVELEERFLVSESHDGLWGVYRFKRGFGGDVKRSTGAFDIIFKPGLYRLFQTYLRFRGSEDA